VQIGELLGSGRSADVFAIDDRWVLRRYRGDGDATDEAAVMAYLADRGFPVPAIHPATFANPDASSSFVRTDLVMQRLSGPTMLQALVDTAITPEQAGKIIGRLLHRLHTIPARVSVVPGDRILHLDLHPDNVMLTPQGPVVIDWCNSAEGQPGLDWAMSALIHAQFAVDTVGEMATAARVALSSLLGALDGTVDLGDVRTGHLARARARRAADPALSPREVKLLDTAVALVLALRR
jgi:aminoglycoside phosphotransferase (APT) family kinase protein